MSAGVFAIVMLAAAMHALWNAMVKGAADRTIMLGLIATGHVLPALMLVPFVPAPAPASWPFIIASTVIHWGYYVYLNRSYRLGDLSFAYPVARGLAPVLIALGALLAADETLSPAGWLGIATVSGGILILANLRGAIPGALGAAVLTSLCVAAYSIADGLGIRASGSPLGYVVWLFVAEICVALYVLTRFRARLLSMSPGHVAIGVAGGVISAAAYGLVLYAKTLAPLGIVSALRETSVIFAALIGIFWLGEGPAGRRLTAAAIVAAGIGILATTRI